MSSLLNVSHYTGIVTRLHKQKWLRKIARRLAGKLVLTQEFHGGEIAFNAVAHSWAWTSGRSYENFDRPLQERLLALSADRPSFLDIGANIGAMSLSVLLRNPRSHALAVEPGREAAALLRRSLLINRLEHRCDVLNVAASAGEKSLPFDATGSVIGHVTHEGPVVLAVSLTSLIHRAEERGPFLGKIDVEGYESILVPQLAKASARSGSCVVIELHPSGFNSMGDPIRCVAHLTRRPELEVTTLDNRQLDSMDPNGFTQIEVRWK